MRPELNHLHWICFSGDVSYLFTLAFITISLLNYTFGRIIFGELFSKHLKLFANPRERGVCIVFDFAAPFFRETPPDGRILSNRFGDCL